MKTILLYEKSPLLNRGLFYTLDSTEGVKKALYSKEDFHHIMMLFSQQFRDFSAVLKGKNQPAILVDGNMVNQSVPCFFFECHR